MVKREKLKAKFELDNAEETEKSVILLSSSDDEEANEDLSLEIVERARIRETRRKREEDLDEFNACDGVRSVTVIDLASSSSEEFEVVADRTGGGDGGVGAPSVGVKKKMKKKKKKSTKIEEEKTIDGADKEERLATDTSVETEAVDAVETEEPVDTVKAVGTSKPLESEAADISDNVVLRKLLRGPRYFNPPDSSWAMCYNCGEEGHMVANCTSKKRKKPCFVCGSFEHSVKHCTQGQDCFICKRRGHRAKDCPEKHQGSYQNNNICLRCGDSGHNMFSCKSDYAPEDLKEIQCYTCKEFGHLCCVDFIATAPAEVSCYNCGQSGHAGLGCAKLRGETSGAGSATCCYNCGEEGHFARGCTASPYTKACSYENPSMQGYGKLSGETRGARSATCCYNCGKEGHFARECAASTFTKHDPMMGEYTTPTKRFPKEVHVSLGFRSAPHDLGKARKTKSPHYESREFATAVKSKRRGGWITDDPGDLPNRKARQTGGWMTDGTGDMPNRKARANIWKSPATPTKKVKKLSTSTTGGPISNSPWKKPNRFPGTPSSHGSANRYQHRFSASKFGNFSGGFKRTYDG